MALKLNNESIKAMVIINIMDNCNIDIDNTGESCYTLDTNQFNDLVDKLTTNIENLQNN